MTFDEWKIQARKTVQEVTVEEIETENLYADDGRVPQVPFGFRNDKWLQLKNQVQPGDRLCYYCTSPESWKNLAGREGYVLVRGNEIIGDLTTRMN